jgi:glycosyltransferase involved in cell wall biosynthesis
MNKSENSVGLDQKTVLPRQPRVCVVAGFHSPSFSGRVAAEIIAASRGVELALAASELPVYPVQKNLKVSALVDKMLQRPESGRFRLWVMPPSALPQSLEQGEMWCYTAFDPFFCDVSALKKLKKAERIWVPSARHVEACVKAGCKRDSLRVFPVPVNLRTFHPRVVCPARFAPEPGYFRFILSASPVKRKGIKEVLQAFIKEFKADEKVELVIRLTQFPRPRKEFSYEIADLKSRLGALNKMFARVTVIAESLSDQEYAGLLASADAFVAAGTSFNSAVSVREAMACALAVIGPQTLTEFTEISSEHAFLLPVKPVELEAGFLYSGSPSGKSWSVSDEDLRRGMREAYTCCNKSRKMGLAAQRLMKKQNDWKKFALELKEFARERFSIIQSAMEG